MPIERRPSMEMTYTSEQFRGRYYRGNWDVPMIHKMLDWALERSTFNGHELIELVVDDPKQYAIHCLYCDAWGAMSSDKEDFGIWGSAVYSKCKGDQ
jgi:hypothetical protein